MRADTKVGTIKAVTMERKRRYAVVLVYKAGDGFFPLVDLVDKDGIYPTKKEARKRAKEAAEGMLEFYNANEGAAVTFRQAWETVDLLSGDCGFNSLRNDVSIYHIRIMDIY